MRQLIGSLVSLPWAMSLFACEQLAAVARRDAGLRDATARLYAATKATEDRMTDIVWAVFTVGDAIQRGVVDSVGDRSFGAVEQIARDAADCAETWLTADTRAAAVAQLRNSLEVFTLVKHVRDRLAVPSDGVFPLVDYLDRAAGTGDFSELWAIEGLGHDYTDRFPLSPDGPVRLLDSVSTRSLPRSSLTMLHAGLGLSFAQRLLRTVTPYEPADRIGAFLEQFISLCASNSRPGYDGAAFESLGLVTRTWHPQMVAPIDAHLKTVDKRVREFFWHGAGRALYFHPLFIIPGVVSPWRAADTEPPDAQARLNMKAGLAWATTLVNLRQPEVLARLLRTERASIDRDDAFTSGLVSALVMAQDIAPHDRYVEAVQEYCGADMTDDDRSRWQRLVVRPAQDAVRRIQPLLFEQARLGEVFRYHPYPEWFGVAPTVH